MEFNYRQVRTARLRRGFTLRHVASHLEISEGAVSKLETGTLRHHPSLICRLPFVFHLPLSYFTMQTESSIAPEAISFRARRSITKAMQDQTVASCEMIERCITPVMHHKYNMPELDVPDLSGYDPEEAAYRLRSIWNLGFLPTPNLVHLLEVKGVNVYWLAIDSDCVDAVSMWYDGRAYILLNRRKSPERTRYDACHELGHLCLHRNVASLYDERVEKEADRFASAFLMPRHSFAREAGRVATLSGLLSLKPKWKTSVAAMVYNLHTVGMISDARYQFLFREISANGWRKKEPCQLPGYEESLLHPQVFESLRKSGLSSLDFAEQIFLSSEDLFEFMPVARNYQKVVQMPLIERTTEATTYRGLTLVS